MLLAPPDKDEWKLQLLWNRHDRVVAPGIEQDDPVDPLALDQSVMAQAPPAPSLRRHQQIEAARLACVTKPRITSEKNRFRLFLRRPVKQYGDRIAHLGDQALRHHVRVIAEISHHFAHRPCAVLALIRSRVLDNTRDTVEGETPACLATSMIVTDITASSFVLYPS